MSESHQSMGTYLRAARRRRRISIERAAEETKIRSDFLMRMESDEFDFLAPAYVRGFLRTYARYLRVDPDPLISDFERRYGGRVDPTQIIAQQRRGRGRKAIREPRTINSWLLAAGLAAGVLLLLMFIGLAQDRPGGPRDEPRVAREDSEASESPTPTPTPSPTPTPTPTPSPTDAALALADGFDLEIFAVRGECWIDITSDGVNVFSGMLAQGDTETFSAEREMSIVLGLPSSVDLIVNGRNFGSPGGVDPITIKLPDDVESL